ncbi:MAG: excinuclease ABC subunit UvrC [Candidatus Latescibacterota bacterium]|nr:MAG: excinuclease ABC subunit UvrC [Candidatus Latescibacterota bacterium]
MTQRSTKTRLETQIAKLPGEPGVYLFKDSKGRVIYVGKAKELRTRVRSYLRDGADGRHHIQFLLARAVTVDYMVTETEQEALILENNLIKKHRPRYNIFLRDDKTYVNVRLNIDHPFPRLTVVRRPRKDKARYFGPYASAGSVRATLRMLGRVFPLRTCSDAELAGRERPCLYYHIKRCPAPCVGFIDEQAYRDTVNRVTMFLKGRGEELIRSLKDRMDLESAERRYEAASKTRDQLFSLQRTLEKQRVTSPQEAERDVFGVYREKERMVIQALYVRDWQLSGGESFYFDTATLSTSEHLSSFINQYYQSGAVIPSEVVVSVEVEDKSVLETYLRGRREGPVRIILPKRGERRHLLDLALKNARAAFEDRDRSDRFKEALEEIQDVLELKSFPRRIECFDVSNLRGKQAVASRVTFIGGEPVKSLYRHYKVRTVESADDYAMMEEVLERRIARGIKEGDLPDLLMVDGGKGQLGVALKVLDRLGVEDLGVLGIAKVKEHDGKRRVRGKERIYTTHLREPLLLEGGSGALRLLQRIRDEAHRFAITYHKKLRSKRLEESVIDAIPGVGPLLKRRLLKTYGSVAGLRKASVAELASIQGVSRKLAVRIQEFLAHRS